MASTKGNFSQTPSDVLAAAVAKNYVAVHVEQGVPVLDRDLNLLGDLLGSTLRGIVQRNIGNGIAGTTDFTIQANGNQNDFAILAGTCIVNGVPVTLAANTSYLTQTVPLTASPAPPLPALTTPTVPRLDTVYLDTWLDEIDESGDDKLGNPLDVGIRTSTRIGVSFCVRVYEGATIAQPLPPTVPTGHTFYPLAQLARLANVTVLTSAQITDLRQKNLSMSVLEGRLRALEGLLAPVVTSFGPETVTPGQANAITVTGRNFQVGTIHVFIAGTECPVDAASLTNGSMSVHVPITTPSGTYQFIVKNDIGTTVATDPVNVLAPPPPPTFGPGANFTPNHGAPGATITLNGSHFTGVTRVTFNTATPIAALLGGDLLTVAAGAITVKVPAALTTPGTCTVTASIDGAPTMTGTSTDPFTIDAVSTQQPPSYTFSPTTQSHGGQITITGSNLGTSTSTTQVIFQGTNTVTASASDMVSVATDKIVVKVPASLTVAASPNNQASITVSVTGLPVKSLTLLNVL